MTAEQDGKRRDGLPEVHVCSHHDPTHAVAWFDHDCRCSELWSHTDEKHVEQDGFDLAKVSEPQVLRSLPVDICTACIRGAGGECHTPGCMFWTCSAPTPEQAQRFQQQATTGRAGRSMAERQRDGARARADVLERQAEDFYARLIEVLNPDDDELEPSEVVDLVRDLTALALDLQGKVARVEALALMFREHAAKKEPVYGPQKAHLPWVAAKIDEALADPTPAARCPQQTPFVALSEPTCTRPEGHEGAHLFTSYDGKTPLEMMPK